MSKRKGVQQNIGRFFKKENVSIFPENVETEEISRSDISPEKLLSVDPVQTSSIRLFSNNDIGLAVCERNISAESRYEFLKNAWVPSANFIFPTNIETGQNRKFQRRWLTEYPWLSYSEKDQGSYCRICVLFGPNDGGRSKQRLGCLVKEPLRKYKKALQHFTAHAENEYHKAALIKAENFSLVWSAKKANSVIFSRKF